MNRGLLFHLLIFCYFLNSYSANYTKTLPVIFINTEDSITSKEEYVGGIFYIETFGINGLAPIGSRETPKKLQIRYRGNYTLRKFNKKPYKIKFDKSAEILGLKANKHFALLAHADANRGFLRNTVCFYLGKRFEMDFTPEQVPVELVLNGDYKGLYFLTETIRVGKNRLSLTEQEDYETQINVIDNSGWLVEIDNYEDVNQIEINGLGTSYPNMKLTYHHPENLSDEQKNYLSDQFNTFYDILRSNGNDGNALLEFVDVGELAKYYLVAEITDQLEAFLGSCYIHKDKNTKWRFGHYKPLPKDNGEGQKEVA